MQRPGGSQPDAASHLAEREPGAPAPPEPRHASAETSCSSSRAADASHRSQVVTYPAVDASVPEARRAAAEFAAAAGVIGAQLDAIKLAVSEAVTNVVRHAYRGVRGDLQLTLGACSGELWVLVSDEGCGHHRAASDPGLGLGLALIADACDEFVLTERGSGGTEAQMRFVVRGGGGPA